MAHRGKYFPVAFRRDFNFNSDVSSTTALAERYTVHLDSGVRPPYICDGNDFVCQEIAGPNPATLAWLSPAARYGIWLWQLRLHVAYNALPDTDLQSTWFLERDAILVSSWRTIGQSRTNPMGHASNLLGTVLFTDFTTFDRGAFFYNSLFDPTGYPP